MWFLANITGFWLDVQEEPVISGYDRLTEAHLSQFVHGHANEIGVFWE
jgi:hypothetical protein